MSLPQLPSFEVSAVKSTYILPMTSRIADVAFGTPTGSAGVPTPVHWY